MEGESCEGMIGLDLFMCSSPNSLNGLFFFLAATYSPNRALLTCTR